MAKRQEMEPEEIVEAPLLSAMAMAAALMHEAAALLRTVEGEHAAGCALIADELEGRATALDRHTPKDEA